MLELEPDSPLETTAALKGTEQCEIFKVGDNPMWTPFYKDFMLACHKFYRDLK